MRTLTVERLEKLGACESKVEEFREVFDEGTPINEEAIIEWFREMEGDAWPAVAVLFALLEIDCEGFQTACDEIDELVIEAEGEGLVDRGDYEIDGALLAPEIVRVLKEYEA